VAPGAAEAPRRRLGSRRDHRLRGGGGGRPPRLGGRARHSRAAAAARDADRDALTRRQAFGPAWSFTGQVQYSTLPTVSTDLQLCRLRLGAPWSLPEVHLTHEPVCPLGVATLVHDPERPAWRSKRPSLITIIKARTTAASASTPFIVLDPRAGL